MAFRLVDYAGGYLVRYLKLALFVIYRAVDKVIARGADDIKLGVTGLKIIPDALFVSVCFKHASYALHNVCRPHSAIN